MTRTAYYEHPDYVPLILRANVLWRELEDEIGEELLHQVGGIYLGKLDGEVISGSLRSAREHNLPHEFLTRDAAQREVPAISTPPDYAWPGFRAGDGRIPADGEMRRRDGARGDAARRGDSWAREGDRVGKWFGPDGPGGISREKNRILRRGVDVEADCGSGHSPGRDAADGGMVLAERAEAFRERAGVGDRSEGGTLLRLPDARGDAGGARCAPCNRPGDRSGCGGARDVSKDVETLRKFMAELLPDANGSLISVKTCLYTNSPDHHFYSGAHPRMKDGILAAGFSGHGFKFATR